MESNNKNNVNKYNSYCNNYKKKCGNNYRDYNKPNNCNKKEPRKAYIDVLNYGGFFVRFNGTYTIGHEIIEFSVGAFALGQEKRVELPLNATNINLTIEFEFFIGYWETLCTRYYEVSDEYCFVAYGVTTFPFCKNVPCPSPGILS